MWGSGRDARSAGGARLGQSAILRPAIDRVHCIYVCVLGGGGGGGAGENCPRLGNAAMLTLKPRMEAAGHGKDM